MLPNDNHIMMAIMMALLAAYCALASPVKTHSAQVQGAIEALKAQLKADNITDASDMVNEAEASLWADGVVKDEIIAKLELEI